MSDKPLDLRDRPIFICGHPKAGTSLVRAIFDSHPQLIVYPEETIFFRRFLPQAVSLDLEGQLALAEQCLIHIFKWNRLSPAPGQEDFPNRDYSAIPFDAVCQAMRDLASSQHRHPGDILSAAMLAYGQVSLQNHLDLQYWVEKSPYNEYFANQIFTWWPDARCIHIVRDPRDNFVSYRRKHPDWQAEFFAANWNRSTRAGLKNLGQFGPHRCQVLRYEDLVQNPETSLQGLADFLGITWDVSLASPTRAGADWAGNSMFSEQYQSISSAPVGRWKEKLTAQDAAVIEMMARPWMQALQYGPSEAASHSSQTLAARWRVFSWPVRRRLSRLRFKSHELPE